MEGDVFHVFGYATTSVNNSVEVYIADGVIFDHHVDDDKGFPKHHCVGDVIFF